MDGVSKRVCSICSQAEGRYQCPRCNIFYCSADCYKNPAHVKCSEEFYEECVKNEIKSLEPNDQETQKKMYEILQRLNKMDESGTDEELDSDDDEDDISLADRLKDINLDQADEVWEKLTNEEKRQFEELLKSNDVTGILPEYEPWWDYRDERKMIDLDEILPFEKNHKQKCPVVNSKNIMPFCKLSKAVPSPNVYCNLANVLAAYVFTVRYFNGDHRDYPSESSVILITLSKNLFNNEIYFSFETAVKSVFIKITSIDFLEGYAEMNSTVESDVTKILNGPDDTPPNKTFYILSALSDIYELFSKAVKVLKTNPESSTSQGSSNGEFSKRFPDSGVTTLPDVSRLKIKNCLKKIEYYLSWSNEHFNPVN